MIMLLLFVAGWAVVAYLANCIFAKRVQKINIRYALLYVATVAMCGVFGEVFFGTLYAHFLGSPLWQYTISPLHHGFTSLYALVLWGFVGFQLYLMHENLKRLGLTSTRKLAFIFCAEAIILEALVNLSFLALFGKYIFFYLPNDLWHLTSFQTLPFYLVGGYIVVVSIEKFKASPVFFTLLNLMQAVVLILVA
jgi:hypothetical protein